MEAYYQLTKERERREDMEVLGRLNTSLFSAVETEDLPALRDHQYIAMRLGWNQIDDDDDIQVLRPLSLACKKKNVSAVAILHEAGYSDPDALYMATKYGFVEGLRRLHGWHRPPSMPLLHAAVVYRQYKALQTLLLDLHENPNATNDQGATTLHCAAQRQDVRAMRLLLKRGARPNYVDHAGETPLHYLARRGTKDVAVRVLLDAGADPMIRNTSGQTAKDLLRKRNASLKQPVLLTLRDAPPILKRDGK